MYTGCSPPQKKKKKKNAERRIFNIACELPKSVIFFNIIR